MSGSKKLPEPRVKKEKDLAESKGYYQVIFENTGAATLFFDEDSSITLVNNEFQKLTGYSQKDLDGKKWLDLISNEDIERVERYHNLRMVDPNSAPRNYEFKFKRKDGSIGDAFITIALIPGTKKSIASFIDITERKKVQRDLMLSQERYRAIVEDQKDMISRFLPDGTLTFVNEAHCKFFGVNKEHTIGHSFFDFLSADGRKRIEKFINSISKKNYKGMIEDIWKYPNGQVKWVQWNYSAIFKDKCNITEIQASGRDITDLKESEKKLKESEKKFRVTAETASDTIFMADASSGKLIFCNDAAVSMYGYKKEELVGKQGKMMVPEEERPNFGKGFEQCKICNEYTFIGPLRETWGLRKDGSKFPTEISISKCKMGKKEYITSIVRDITQRKESEKQIKFQANILENVRDSVIVTDLQGKIVYWNKGASSIFGYSSDEAIGKNMNLLYLDEDKEQFERNLKYVKVRDCVEEKVCMRKDGSWVWVDVRVTKMLDLDGNIIGFVNVSKDITERKKIQNEIKASLEEKEMLLGEINERVSKYMQMISDLLQLHSLYIENKEEIDVVKDSQSRVKSIFMIHEVISQSDDFGIIDFSEYIENLVKDVVNSYGVDENRIKFNITVDNILDIYTAIPCGLISNELVINSIKYAFPDGMNGKVNIDFEKDDNGNCVLTVEDNGIGFPEGLDFKNMDKMGLNLVKTLVKQLNATINVIQGKGTKFQIKFKELEY